jgi:hypothetical protein
VKSIASKTNARMAKGDTLVPRSDKHSVHTHRVGWPG